MRLSLKWLSSFIDLDGLSTEEIIDKTVKAGFEVADREYLAKASGLVAGKVIECHDHPDSDHLHVTKVDIGDEVLDIVCGAPNCRTGIKVIVAKVGAILPEVTIKASTIRGVASNGMLCSLLELGVKKELLDDDSPSLSGIEELDDSFEIGETDILSKLGLDDEILEIELTANRSDCLSVFAMAKEMAAILDRKCTLPEYEGASDIGKRSDFHLESKTANCPHFLAKVVGSVTIKESPAWMKEHLIASGVKSINNVIDISNYVMLETGQPMHFYDLRTNPQRELVVVDDYEGPYTALDGVTYDIKKGDIMITDDGRPSGIAGIMGGENTKILDDTTAIIIESALFDGPTVRRTANRLGLQTEAAMRFAKGLDPLAQKKAVDRAVQLLIEYADAKDIEETVEWGKEDYEPYEVVETVEHLNMVDGTDLSEDDIVNILRRLDFRPYVDKKGIHAIIPSYRSADIKIAEDIDEEVIRLIGYDDLKATLPKMPMTIGKLTRRQSLRREIRDVLANSGLHEVVSYTLGDAAMVEDELLPIGEAICLSSPLNDARKYIRVGLFNSLCDTLAYNLAHSNRDVSLFEISTLYAKEGVMKEHLAVILNGDLQSSKVLHTSTKADFYVIKGLALELLSHLGYDIGRVRVEVNDLDTVHLHPYRSCVLKLGKETLAILGAIHPSYLKSKKIEDAYYLELDLDLLVESSPSKIQAKKISKYPEVSRDLSFVFKDDIAIADIMRTMKKAGGPLVKHIEVFDIYRGDQVKKGHRSISFNIVYSADDRTLKVEDIMPVHEKIMQVLSANYGADLRS